MKRITITLRGHDYQLSREQVEEAVEHMVPKPVDKYYVIVNGRRYPPKQVVAAMLRVPLVSFTTMDAGRILSALEFDVLQSGIGPEAEKTESEVLFEAYLNAAGLTEFEFQPDVDGTSKKPDYQVLLGNDSLFFEVKEFRATPQDFRGGSGAYDPYQPIREKINAARKKFQEVEGSCCCVILYNREKPLIDLGWQFVYGAMLGNLAIQMPFDGTRLITDEAKSVYGDGGRVLYQRAGRFAGIRNTTLSAILALRQFRVGQRRFQVDVRRKERELGHKLNLEEFGQMMELARGTERDVSLTQLRVVVHENPFAKVPLPRTLFCGPYDERYGLVDDHIERVFAGEAMRAIEKEENL